MIDLFLQLQIVGKDYGTTYDDDLDGWFSWHIEYDHEVGANVLELRFEPRDEELHRHVVEHWKMERV